MTQYMVYSRRDSGGLGHIAIRSRAALGNTWGSETTLIDENDTGLDAAIIQLRFPQLIREGGQWWMFFSSETSSVAPKIWRAESSNSDPTVAGSWGTITEVLAGSTTASAFDRDGVAGPFVVRVASGDWIMLYTGYNPTDNTYDEWQGGIAEATAIDGTWTRYSGNPVWPSSTVITDIDGADPGPRRWTVVSSGSFAAGMPINAGHQVPSGGTIDRVKFRPNRARAIPSGTEIEGYFTATTATGSDHVVAAYDYCSVHPRSLLKSRDAGYDWEMWCTLFKFESGEEVVGRYMGTGSNPRTATWTLDDSHSFPWAPLTKRSGSGGSYADFLSEENPGFIFDEDHIILPDTSLPRRVAVVT